MEKGRKKSKRYIDKAACIQVVRVRELGGYYPSVLIYLAVKPLPFQFSSLSNPLILKLLLLSLVILISFPPSLSSSLEGDGEGNDCEAREDEEVDNEENDNGGGDDGAGEIEPDADFAGEMER